ncbi:MAG: M50 family metallopeptidase, partial [Pseudonocardia sp.]|nr:M50 family metallopeptidase [Pseudonocardia sp.]
KAWSLLWATLVLLLGAWSQFRGALAGAFLLLAGAGIGYVAAVGSPPLQNAVAVALVWLMLLGGVRAVAGMSIGEPSDSWRLARSTWIPAFLWAGLFWFVAVACLWVGTRRLLGV